MTLAPNWKNCPNCAAKDAEMERLTRALNNLRYEFAIARHAWSAQERSDEAQPKEER